MVQSLRLGLSLSVAFLLTPAAQASGQGLSIGVHAGHYVATQDVYEASRGSASLLGDYRMRSAVTKGAAITFWMGPRFGLSVSGGATNSSLTFTPLNSTGTPAELGDVELRHGALQAVALLAPPEAIIQPYLSGGMGYVKRGGQGFQGQNSGGHVGLALGAGLRVKAVGVAFWGGAELVDYSARYSISGLPYRSFLQRDIQVRAGLTVPLLGEG